MRKGIGVLRPEYLMEGFGLGLFMVSACFFAALLEASGSPLHRVLENAVLRRVLMGAAMGLTAVGLIYSPWGRRCGAHFNPAVTLTFLRLQKISARDAFFYVSFQFLGAIIGVTLASGVLGSFLAEPGIRFAATLPPLNGEMMAFLAEMLISFILMAAVLIVSNHPFLSRWTGVCAGLLIAAYIIFEAPLSGMSMNPARTLGSAVFAQAWQGLWIYFIAPPLGMLLAAELYVRSAGLQRVFCAKLNHSGHERCIFRCRYREIIPQKPESFYSTPASNC